MKLNLVRFDVSNVEIVFSRRFHEQNIFGPREVPYQQLTHPHIKKCGDHTIHISLKIRKHLSPAVFRPNANHFKDLIFI